MTLFPRFEPSAEARELVDALLQPLGFERSLAEYYEQKPLHLPAPPGPSRVLLGAATLEAALRQPHLPRDFITLRPERFNASRRARGEPPVPLEGFRDRLLDDPGLLTAYIADGHPIAGDMLTYISPETARTGHALAQMFEAEVWCNLYYTGPSGSPFPAHFDHHEVLLVQCEGEKDWHIYEKRVNRPLDVPEMADALAQIAEQQRAEAVAGPAMTFTARPGDVVYIPRGQFHDAVSPRGRSLHVNFSFHQTSGVDVARTLARLCMIDPECRSYLPISHRDPGGDAGRAALKNLIERLGALLDGDKLHADLARLRDARISRSGGPPEAWDGYGLDREATARGRTRAS
jgi:hypothetical protein